MLVMDTVVVVSMDMGDGVSVNGTVMFMHKCMYVPVRVAADDGIRDHDSRAGNHEEETNQV